jgi:hypothetical protein
MDTQLKRVNAFQLVRGAILFITPAYELKPENRKTITILDVRLGVYRQALVY